jgi:phosphomannomutase
MFTSRDIRGFYGSEITDDKLKILGQVLDKRELVIGMDYREYNDKILNAILPSLERVIYVGNVPTPVVPFLTKRSGMMITASHNPPGYNGIKFFKPKRILNAEELQHIKQQYEDAVKQSTKLNESSKTNLKVDEEQIRRYITSIPEIKEGIFDLCGGAACSFANLFPVSIFNTPDPPFRLHAPEPTNETLDRLKEETMKAEKIGYAFDGDADRVVVIVKGQMIPGDILIAYTATHYLPSKEKLILSFDCSQEVFNYIQDSGQHPYYATVGQSALATEAIKRKAGFIGEYSGHYSFTKFMYYSDPFYFIGKISETKPRELLEFQAQFHNVVLREKVEGRIDYTLLKQELEKWTDQFVLLDGIKAILAEEGASILIRHSQSEPITRINVEGKNIQTAKEILQKVKEIIGKIK